MSNYDFYCPFCDTYLCRAEVLNPDSNNPKDKECGQSVQRISDGPEEGPYDTLEEMWL